MNWKTTILWTLFLFGCKHSSEYPEPTRVTVMENRQVVVHNQTYSLNAFQDLCTQWRMGNGNSGIVFEVLDQMTYSDFGVAFEGAINCGIWVFFFSVTRGGEEHVLSLRLCCPCPPPRNRAHVSIQPNGSLSYEIFVEGQRRLPEPRKQKLATECFGEMMDKVFESIDYWEIWLQVDEAVTYRQFSDVLLVCHQTRTGKVVITD